MIDGDKKQFSEMVSGVLQVHGRPANTVVLKIWWGALEPWPIKQVQAAFDLFVREGGNPIPSSIIKLLPDPYGHPKPEDAWNAAQKDEYTEGAYMTQEMLNAAIAANDSISRGDMIGARKCFLEVYEDNVREAKREKRRAVFRYFQPIGQTTEQKHQIEAAATHEALARGWISEDMANEQLGYIGELPQRFSASGKLVQIGEIKK